MNSKTYDQFVTFGKDNVEALVQSGNLAVEGFGQLADAYAAWTDSALTQTTTGLNKLLGVKAPAELSAAWTELARANSATAVAEARKIQQLTAAVTTRSLAPLATRLQALTDLGKAA